ncbi:unnamed protein product (macronuclear) [Paramecium tetraurelia]|uniref:Protein kinase domain-containing protein n=1 Tax=Paramecium tetraurelia TaxID=5888 RepID=A0EA29_PARTE|nr:uncharacterized protein GSPATT00024878001 [Paramecium tetraurelia]CAK92146.1 unnamed protein product [Paramecium tetraurelia]|eukprot:XP_001459543.1 hypothetical protein (macronuclear) [Paramecium tetraurelia strain d4-2]
MQEQLNLRCEGYNIQFVSMDNEKLISYKAKLINEYLVNDLMMEGKYFREVVKQIDDQTFLVKHPRGQTLEQFIQMSNSIPEKIIETILVQILEGLATLYKFRIPGRCFSIYNITWDGTNITMMNFGLYPEICETLIKYNHNLDTLLLGEIAYCLITCSTNVKKNYIDALISPPISQSLKQLTSRMLSPENERIQLWEVAEDFKNNMSEDAYKFYINKYQNCCKSVDQIIEDRESLACSTIDISDQLKSDQFKIQEDMSYLLYYNKQINKDQIIWDQLHDELYRIYILTNLKQIIDEKYKVQEISIYLDQLKFIVDKTILIVMCQFQRLLSAQFSSESFCQLRKILKDKVYCERQFFNAHDIEAIKGSTKVKKDTGKHFQMEIFEEDFNDIKLAFRSYVLNVYRFYQKNAQNCQDPQEKWELSKIQFQVLMAIILNQVMNNKEIHFQTVKKVVGTDNIRLNDIEIRFFKYANAEDIQEQISEIHKIYFSK